jgi:hypothetical protein
MPGKNINSEKWLNFDFSQYFQTSPLISVWVSSLAQFANDINTSNGQLLLLMEGFPTRPSPEVVYYFALTCAHLREGVKFIQSTIQDEEVILFIAELEDDNKAQLENIKISYEPWETSFIRRVVKPMRDSFFHYAEPKGSSWNEVMDGLKGERGEIQLKGKGLEGIRFVFADDVRATQMEQILGASGTTLEESVTQLANIIVNIILFARATVIHLIEKMPDGSLKSGKR